MMERTELVKRLLLERQKSAKQLRRFMETKREYLPGMSLLMKEAHFLSAVGDNGATGTEIAECMETSLGAVSQLANRLEKEGYITRMKVKEDKRQSLFLLTERGKTLRQAHDQYDEIGYTRMSEKLSRYSDVELEYLIEYEKLAGLIYGNITTEPYKIY